MAISEEPDMNPVMEALAESRPVFHSESDFKHALSWQIQQTDPSLRIRQEGREPDRGTRPALCGHLAPGLRDRHRAEVPD